ncbi:CHAT domain-containing protein [Cyathus striatus]|nr:CHAT domain-containing protein [Cyathus striatus]
MAISSNITSRSDSPEPEQDEKQAPNDSKLGSYVFLEISITYEPTGQDISYIFLSILSEDEGSISIESLKKSSWSKWKSNRAIAWPDNFSKVRIDVFSEVGNSRIDDLGSTCLVLDEVQQAFETQASYNIGFGSELTKGQIVASKVDLPFDIIDELTDPTAESQEILVLEMDTEEDETIQVSPDALLTSAALFLQRFEATNARMHVDNAILLYEAATLSFEPASPNYSIGVYKAGIAYLERFGLLNNLEDIDFAIQKFQEAVSSTNLSDNIELPTILGNLSNAHFYRFEHIGKSNDIDEAVTIQRRAIELTPKEHRFYVRRLNNLGVTLQRRFQHNASIQSYFEGTGNLKDLEEAIPLQQRAIDLVDDSDVNKAVYFSNLGNILRRKFNFEGKIDNINWAIDVQQKAVNHSDPQRDASHSSYLNNLANCLICRYDRLGNIEDLAEGIKMQRKAIQLKARKHAEYARHHNNLGTSLIRWYEHTGNVDDINEAVLILRKAVESLEEKSTEYATYLGNLGTALQCRFEHTFHLDDIEEAIAVLQQGLSLTPESAANYVNHLESLGRAYQDRFERTGSLKDLDEAVTLQQRAVDLTSESSPSLPAYLGNLGNTIWCRMLRADDPTGIDRAIEVHQRAVDLTPDGHPDLPNHLHNLANSLRHRCENGGTLESIDLAISVQKRAISLTSDDNPELPRRLETLGLIYRCRLDNTDADEDLEKAISIFKKVIQLTPEQHLTRWSKFHALAALLGRRFHGSGKQEHIEEAISCYRSAAFSTSGLPLNRIKSARHWAKTYLAYVGHDPDRLLEAYDLAFQLLPQTVWLGYTIKGRHDQLKDIVDLSNEAAAVAISSGELEKGLQWLEQGRCIVWSQLSSLRHPVDAVREKEPELAEDLLRVSMQLQAASSRVEDEKVTSNMMQKISIQAQVREHQRAAEEWQSLLNRTRDIPGFQNFLQPFSLFNHNLSELPGLVVVVNVHLMRCDALVLDNKKPHITHVPLPNFSVEIAQKLLKILNETFVNNNVRMRDSRGGRPVRPKAAPKGLKLILKELWIAVVQPILNALGLMDSEDRLSTENKRRIWWCPTGLLTFLPLHAAGLYDIPGGPNCSDFVVSSYIPNVSALFEKIGRTIGSSKRLLAIGQSKVKAFPFLSELSNVINEIEVVRNIFDQKQIQANVLIEDEVTVSSVLEIMGEYHWIHLACHASQEQNPPTKSGFYLNDGQLTIGELIQKSLPQAEFAFLSACQTSTGDQELSEEAIHLAAGMLAAGYGGVVATMWSILDEYAPVVAQGVYSYLLDEKNKVEGNVSPAEALHHAIKGVRNEYGDEEMALLSWVPYIHMGL